MRKERNESLIKVRIRKGVNYIAISVAETENTVYISTKQTFNVSSTSFTSYNFTSHDCCSYFSGCAVSGAVLIR